MQAFPLGVNLSQNVDFVFVFYLNDNVSFPGPCAIQLPVLFYHNYLSFLFNLLHVFLHLVKDTAVVLLRYTDKLEKTNKNNKESLRTIIQYVSLFCRTYYVLKLYSSSHPL